jgi:hypothetical protein
MCATTPADRLSIAKVEIDAMLRDGTASRCEISWSYALHIVPKKAISWRTCSTPGPFPTAIPSVTSMITPTSSLVVIYNQFPVHPSDIQKTAITTPFGLFEFPFMSFGLRNAA